MRIHTRILLFNIKLVHFAEGEKSGHGACSIYEARESLLVADVIHTNKAIIEIIIGRKKI